MNLDEAIKRTQWIYCNFWHKDKNASNIEELVSLQNTNIKSTYPNLKLSTERAPNRDDGLETYIRAAPHDERKMDEITGFIDCGEFIAFFVLHSTKELRNINLIKLSHILKYSTPFELSFDNTKVIKQMEAELDGIYDVYELAAAHNQLAKWYSEMNQVPKEMEHRRLCWNTKPEVYENITPLIQGELNLENISEAINYSVSFFDIAPKNPTVMQDLLSIYESSKNEKWFEEVVSVLKVKYKSDKEALANICLHYALYLEHIDKKTKSIEHFELALNLFKQIDENHYVIQQINEVLASNIHDR